MTHENRVLLAIVVWYPFFLIPALLGWLPVWFNRRHAVVLTFWDFANLIAPWIIWMGLTGFFGRGKSLANIIEAYILAAFAVGAFAYRVRSGQRGSQQRAAALALVASCSLAVVLWAFVPALPE